MENAPLIPARHGPDKKPEGKKKKNNAEALGVFAVDSNPSKNPKPIETESIWDKLNLTKRKNSESEEALPLSQILEQADGRPRPRSSEQASRREMRRIEALEANQLHGKKATPERIGHVVVTAEGKPAMPIKQPERPEPKIIDKRIETMSRAELLDLSSKVTVEGTTLRQVYETHLIGEQGLRRLISEYVQGGDVQRVLRQELVEHEIDFERDPILRDRKRSDATIDNTSLNVTLESLLEKANVFGKGETQEELAILKARQVHQEQQRHLQQKHRRLIDISMVAAIALLFGLVIMLLLRHS